MRSVFGYFAAVWNRSRLLARALLILRVPALAALGGFLVMRTGQMRESVTVLTEDFRGLDQIAQPTFAVAGVLGAAFALWFCGRFFSLAAPLYENAGPPGTLPRGHDPLLQPRLAYFLAVLPVFIATGYLTFCFNRFFWTMRDAGLAMTWSAWFVLAVLIVAGLVFAFTVLMLVLGIIREPRSDGILDRGATTALFLRRLDPAKGMPEADLIGAYVLIGRGLQWLLQRLAGDIDDASVVARAYGLAPARPRAPQAAAFGLPTPKQSAALKMVAAAGLDGPPPTKPLPPAGLFSGIRRRQPVVPPLNTALNPALDPLGSSWAQIRQASAAWQYALLAPALVLSITATLLLLSPLAFLAQAPLASEAIGTVAIVQSFVVMLLLVLTLLYRRSDVLIIIALLAVLCAWFDLNDTHHIRPLAASSVTTPAPAANAPASTEAAFAQWLDSRKDKDRYERYPVYVVAAPGGGIYAAYHAAIFLARMQDVCPAFAQHLFAISSVSGGSVGSGVFAALARTQAANTETQAGAPQGCAADAALTGAFKPGPMETRAREILAHDLLSPAVSAALFPDLVLQALPVCPTDRIPYLCLKGFDRARALEVAFENAWFESAPSDAAGINPLAESYYGLWSPTAATPALLVNTTSVETGERVVVSPFRDIRSGDSLHQEAADGRRRVPTLLNTAGDLDLRLSTAVGISARFPGISPAAWYRPRGEAGATSPPPAKKQRLVDGGYFDNSGLATALDAIDAIVAAAPTLADRKPLDIRLIVLTVRSLPPAPDYSFSEVLSVARALLNAREEHGRRIEELARAQIAASASRPGPASLATSLAMSYAVLDTGPHTLPLGWQLSRDSRTAIEAAAGRLPAPGDCRRAASAGMPISNLSGPTESACTMATIRTELMKRR